MNIKKNGEKNETRLISIVSKHIKVVVVVIVIVMVIVIVIVIQSESKVNS